MAQLRARPAPEVPLTAPLAQGQAPSPAGYVEAFCSVSTALRVAGMTREPWPATSATELLPRRREEVRLACGRGRGGVSDGGVSEAGGAGGKRGGGGGREAGGGQKTYIILVHKE